MSSSDWNIKDNKCEVCAKPAICGMLDSKNKVRYSCFSHVVDVWKRILILKE